MKKKLLGFLMLTLLLTLLTVATAFAAESNYLWPLPAKLGEYYENTKIYIYANGGWNNDRGDHDHQGIDINAPKGMPIYAAKSGIARNESGDGQGTCVVVFHEDGWATCYMHMNSLTITDGQRVKQGDLIGYVGRTGAAGSNHLHFEISRVENTSNYWTYDTIDPESVKYIYSVEELAKPKIKANAGTVFPSQDVTLSWGTIFGAEQYQLDVTLNGKNVYSKKMTATSAKVRFTKKGSYQAKVTAIGEEGQKETSNTATFKVETSLSRAAVTVADVKYRGEWMLPKVTVKAGGKTLVKGRDYKLKYSSNKYPGKGNVKVTGIGSYSGVKNVHFRIYLPKVSTFQVSKKTSNAVSLKWKNPGLATGYQIYRSTSKNGTYKHVTTVKKAKTLSYTNSKLKSGNYYYKIRIYRTVKGKTYYSDFGSPISAAVKANGSTNTGNSGIMSTVKVKISSGYLNARKGAGTSYAINGKYKNGETLKVTQVKGKWVKTQKGWVSSDYVSASNAKLTGNDVNCRAGSSTSSKVVKELNKGTKVKLYAKSGDWYLTSAGGWVIQDYLAKA